MIRRNPQDKAAKRYGWILGKSISGGIAARFLAMTPARGHLFATREDCNSRQLG
jgi:hypothetical protein